MTGSGLWHGRSATSSLALPIPFPAMCYTAFSSSSLKAQFYSFPSQPAPLPLWYMLFTGGKLSSSLPPLLLMLASKSFLVPSFPAVGEWWSTEQLSCKHSAHHPKRLSTTDLFYRCCLYNARGMLDTSDCGLKHAEQGTVDTWIGEILTRGMCLESCPSLGPRCCTLCPQDMPPQLRNHKPDVSLDPSIIFKTWR